MSPDQPPQVPPPRGDSKFALPAYLTGDPQTTPILVYPPDALPPGPLPLYLTGPPPTGPLPTAPPPSYEEAAKMHDQAPFVIVHAAADNS